MQKLFCDGKDHIKNLSTAGLPDGSCDLTIFYKYSTGKRFKISADLCENHLRKVIDAIEVIINCKWKEDTD